LHRRQPQRGHMRIALPHSGSKTRWQSPADLSGRIARLWTLSSFAPPKSNNPHAHYGALKNEGNYDLRMKGFTNPNLQNSQAHCGTT
jgi:hypothetical protein